MSGTVDGHHAGPDATVRANDDGLTRLDAASAVLAVEGVSDQIAVERAADVLGIDLAQQGVLVLPIGGAQAMARVERDLHRRRPDVRIVGLCDENERRWFEATLGPAATHVCVADLEDELARSAGRDLVERVVDQEGDRRAFATMRAQPQWRARPFESQFRRFVSAGARRKLRYASALVAALGPDGIPDPVRRALADVTVG